MRFLPLPSQKYLKECFRYEPKTQGLLGGMGLAPALAAGNTVVVKPPEVNSLSLLRLGELAKEAGLPDGCLNIVTGLGHEAGDAMVVPMSTNPPCPNCGTRRPVFASSEINRSCVDPKILAGVLSSPGQ